MPVVFVALHALGVLGALAAVLLAPLAPLVPLVPQSASPTGLAPLTSPLHAQARPVPEIGRDQRPRRPAPGDATERPIPSEDELLSQRSIVRLRLDCASEIGRKEVTLFGNGTVRLREGEPGDEVLYLGELRPDELEGYLRRIEDEDLSETDRAPLVAEGPWVEHCLLELLPRGRDPRAAVTFEVSRYQSVSLALSRILTVADELEGRVIATAGPGVPLGYDPAEGDLLERTDGALFEVVRKTGDGTGVEVRGVQLPLTLYVPIDGLNQVFLRLVDPAERAGWDHDLEVRELEGPGSRRSDREDGEQRDRRPRRPPP